MNARRRSRLTRDLPPGLYVRPDGYYYFRDPINHKVFGLGYDRNVAVAQSAEAVTQIAARRTARATPRPASLSESKPVRVEHSHPGSTDTDNNLRGVISPTPRARRLSGSSQQRMRRSVICRSFR